MTCMIAKLRKQKKITQSQLAEICGVSQQSISKIEVGNGNPSYLLAAKIAHALGCTTDELYADEPRKEVG